MKFFHNIYIALLVFIISIGIFGFSLYHYCFSGTSNEEILKNVIIESGSSINSIGEQLVDEGFIRNKLAFKLYTKITNKTNLKAGKYSLSKDMGLIEIVDILEKGNNYNDKEISILFKEGLNIRKIAKVITDNTNNTEEDVYNLLKDKEYLNELINNYWFIDNEILNDDIYYSLEGYLYPSTYSFKSKDVTVKDIFKTMLDEMGNQLDNYKDKINGKTHELLTLASLVELEGVTLEDRKGIANVFYNRLDKKMTLGSDVTTYYAAKIDMGDRDLYKSELNDCNNYNTRCSTFKRLPISPICSPSIESIIAVLEPTQEDYLYFVADKNRKVYFSKTYNEHNNTISKLKKQGLWYEY